MGHTNPRHFHSNTGATTTKAVTANLIPTPKAIHMISAKIPALMLNNRPPSPHMADNKMAHMVSFRCWFERPLLTSIAGGNEMEMGAVNGGGRDANAILNETTDIDRGIDTIEQNLQRLRFLQQRAIDDPDASQNTQTNRELDALNSETMTLYRAFGERIRKIKSQPASGDPRNKAQLGKVDRKLKAAIQEYQQVDRDFRRNLGAQLERQYRIVNPSATEQEVRTAVEDTSNNQIFEQAVSHPVFWYGKRQY